MQMTDLMKRLAELDAKNPNIQQHTAESTADVCQQCGMAGCKCAPGECTCTPKPGYPKNQKVSEDVFSTSIESSTGKSFDIDGEDASGGVIFNGKSIGEYGKNVTNGNIEITLYKPTRKFSTGQTEFNPIVADQIEKAMSGGEEGMEEGSEFGAYYSEQLAQKVFDMNPNLSTSDRATEVIKAGYSIAVQDLGKKTASYKFSYDEDFPSDFVSAYSHLQKQGQGMEESLEECGPMDSMSQYRSPASINMTAASGEELSGMLKDIMSLAGLHKVEPSHLGISTDASPVAIDEPSGEVDAAPSDMRSLISTIDVLNSPDDEEETDETVDSMGADPLDVPTFDADQYAHQENQPGAGDTPDSERRSGFQPATFESLMSEYKEFVAESNNDARKEGRNWDLFRGQRDVERGQGMKRHPGVPPDNSNKTYEVVYDGEVKASNLSQEAAWKMALSINDKLRRSNPETTNLADVREM